jgi:hypothetical protein
MENVATDEQRHIGFGVKLLSDLRRLDERVPRAVADLLREVVPFTSQVLMPPDWDERYLSVFGYSFDRLGGEGALSLITKLRSAGMPVESLPGPPPLMSGFTPEELSRRGRALAQAGIIGVRERPSRRDPETLALLFDTMTRQVDPDHGLRRPTVFEWDFTDPDVEPWHLVVDNGSSAAHPGRAPKPDVRLKMAYQDFVDIVGRRLDPRRALLSGRLRPRGNPLTLARMGRVFGR